MNNMFILYYIPYKGICQMYSHECLVSPDVHSLLLLQHTFLLVSLLLNNSIKMYVISYMMHDISCNKQFYSEAGVCSNIGPLYCHLSEIDSNLVTLFTQMLLPELFWSLKPSLYFIYFISQPKSGRVDCQKGLAEFPFRSPSVRPRHFHKMPLVIRRKWPAWVHLHF